MLWFGSCLHRSVTQSFWVLIIGGIPFGTPSFIIIISSTIPIIIAILVILVVVAVVPIVVVAAIAAIVVVMVMLLLAHHPQKTVFQQHAGLHHISIAIAATSNVHIYLVQSCEVERGRPKPSAGFLLRDLIRLP